MKHLKSSLRDLRRLFDHELTVRHIAEPFVTFDGPRPAADIRAFMQARDFDVVGVRHDGRVIGFVQRQELEVGAIDDHLLRFDESGVLDESAPLLEVLERLVASPRVFVRVMGEIGAIVTKGDLQKTPVRLWLFGLLSMLEMQCLRLIRRTFRTSAA
jgi:hypothetical protein